MLSGIAYWGNFLVELVVDEKIRNVAVIAGVLVALHSIKTSRLLAKKKQAADLLFASRGDSRLQTGYRYLVEAPAAEILGLVQARSSENAGKVRFLLNHWELMSVGIRAGIYDEEMIKSSWCSVLTKSYHRSKEFIAVTRRVDESPTLWQEFEWLAKRWIAKPLKPKS